MVGRDPLRDWHLQIDPVYLADEGEYQCQVLSRDPTQSIRSKAARLEVRSPCSLPIIAGPGSIELREGSIAQLQCTCSGARPPARLQWKVGGKGVGAGNTSRTEEGSGPITWRTSSSQIHHVLYIFPQAFPFVTQISCYTCFNII